MISRSSKAEYVLDSNILVHVVHERHEFHEVSLSCVSALEAEGKSIGFHTQNAAEFWAVATRRTNEGGLGLSVDSTDAYLDFFGQRFELIQEPVNPYSAWRAEALKAVSTGRHIHDARFAATLKLCGVTKLITKNVRDFRRFPFLKIFGPEDIVAGRR